MTFFFHAYGFFKYWAAYFIADVGEFVRFANLHHVILTEAVWGEESLYTLLNADQGVKRKIAALLSKKAAIY
ncbi:hypothetical protein MACH16_16570 [Marinomonas pontica]|uniref:Uncharacterized protein n=1 Tax=Marinomonas pontica TaxID=264739 RepID=A0ABM8FCU3_9GAMM|nr:hypothetical protein MACH16_16570 [Marinomonas pontica]